jgi:hypothetical protein
MTWRKLLTLRGLELQPFGRPARGQSLYQQRYPGSNIHFFPLALEPNSGLGRLHKTFRFTSVTRSRTVGRTPWTGDQLVETNIHLGTSFNCEPIPVNF